MSDKCEMCGREIYGYDRPLPACQPQVEPSEQQGGLIYDEGHWYIDMNTYVHLCKELTEQAAEIEWLKQKNREQLDLIGEWEAYCEEHKRAVLTTISFEKLQADLAAKEELVEILSKAKYELGESHANLQADLAAANKEVERLKLLLKEIYDGDHGYGDMEGVLIKRIKQALGKKDSER